MGDAKTHTKNIFISVDFYSLNVTVVLAIQGLLPELALADKLSERYQINGLAAAGHRISNFRHVGGNG